RGLEWLRADRALEAEEMNRVCSWRHRCPRRSLWERCGAYHRKIPPDSRLSDPNVHGRAHQRRRAEIRFDGHERGSEFDTQSIQTRGSQASSFGGGMIAVVQMAETICRFGNAQYAGAARAAACSGWSFVLK